MPAPSRTVMQTLFRVASYLVLPFSPIVHLNLPSQYQLKKHQWWPFSTDGTEAHAYPPVEGMISRWVGDANCFNRRFHLIWRWLLLVVTRSLSDYLMLKRSPGPTVAHDELFHRRRGLLLDCSGMEGASSRFLIESSGLWKQELWHWVMWDIYEWYLLHHRGAVLRGMGTFLKA